MENTELVNVYDPQADELGSIPKAQLPEAMQQGYQPATPEQVHDYAREQKYGTLGQQIATGVEGAAEAGTLGLSPLLETGIHKLTGIEALSPEAQLGRREENPGSHLLGNIAGFAVSPLGAGEGKLLSTLGESAAAKVGLGAEEAGSKALLGSLAQGADRGVANAARDAALEAFTTTEKIGSAAVKTAVENALMQGTDETAKMIQGDPNQSVETALLNVGLSGLFGAGLGAGMGAISPLWKATVAPKLEGYLSSVKSRLAGESTIAPEIQEGMAHSGVTLSPESQGYLSGSERAKRAGSILSQSDTTPGGQNFQKAIHEDYKNIADSVVHAVGRTPEDLPEEVSRYQAGRDAGLKIAEKLEKDLAEPAAQFEKVRDQYKDVELPRDVQTEAYDSASNPYVRQTKTIPGVATQLEDKISKLAMDEQWSTAVKDDMMKAATSTIKRLKGLRTLSDLTNLISKVGDETADWMNPQLQRAGALIKNILRDEESNIVLSKLGEQGPEIVEQHQNARAAYRQLAIAKDDLNEFLHVKGGSSVGSFIKNLKELSESSGEKIFNSLSNKANVLEILQKDYPEAAQAIRQFHLDTMLKDAAQKAPKDLAINPRKLLDRVAKLSPELKNFILSPEAQQKLGGAETLLNALKDPLHNFSNTARTSEKLNKDLVSSAMGMVAALSTHNPAAVLLGPLMRYLGKDVPDAARLGMLRFLGSSAPVEAEGFKSMIEMIDHTIKGENLLSRSTKNIFKIGSEVLPRALLPDDKSREKLNKHLEALQADPSPLFNVGGKTAHYLPEHGTALAEVSARAASYLNQQRPTVSQKSPLDSPRKVAVADQKKYNDLLDIAEQPLMAFHLMRNNQLTQQHVDAVKTMYPAFYNRAAGKLQQQMIEAVHRGDKIPYDLRQKLSLFLQTPLDSTLSPQSVMGYQTALQQGAQQDAAKHLSETNMKGIMKGVGANSTPGQAREASRLGK